MVYVNITTSKFELCQYSTTFRSAFSCFDGLDNDANVRIQLSQSANRLVVVSGSYYTVYGTDLIYNCSTKDYIVDASIYGLVKAGDWIPSIIRDWNWPPLRRSLSLRYGKDSLPGLQIV